MKLLLRLWAGRRRGRLGAVLPLLLLLLLPLVLLRLLPLLLLGPRL